MTVEVLKSFSLKHHNTFGIDVKADKLVKVNHEDQLGVVMTQFDQMPWILGGGSNVLLTGDITSPVILNEIDGVEIESVGADHAIVRVGGGVVWHDLVMWAVANDLGGIENLALIPGKVGAAPIQNIGAYGVELKDVFRGLEAVELETGERLDLDPEDCAFGYRDSVFKRAWRNKLFIARVKLRLTKHEHNLNISYGAIQQTLERAEVEIPSIQDVAEAVIAIRSSKLPDPSELGNAGSFFKNPVVDQSLFESLKKSYPDIVSYPADDGVKVPAGWLIERCGWKGKREGNVGCYAKQALVIVNYGGASGSEIFDFAMKVRQSVKDNFGVEIEPEVNVI